MVRISGSISVMRHAAVVAQIAWSMTWLLTKPPVSIRQAKVPPTHLQSRQHFLRTKVCLNTYEYTWGFPPNHPSPIPPARAFSEPFARQSHKPASLGKHMGPDSESPDQLAKSAAKPLSALHLDQYPVEVLEAVLNILRGRRPQRSPPASNST